MISVLKRLFRPASHDVGAEFDLFYWKQETGRNVLIFTEHVNATYFISFDIPLRRLHAEGRVNVAVASQKRVQKWGKDCWVRWYEQLKPDLVVMTRYAQPYGTSIMEFFRERGIPVVYHIDDDLLEMPDSLGAEIIARQGASDVVDERRRMLAGCSLIYASTSYLAEVLRSRFPEQLVYHGIYAPYLGTEVGSDEGRALNYPVLGYMGSKGHRHDLDLAVPAIERLLDERPDLRFEVFGTILMPERLHHFGERVHKHSVQTSYLDFLKKLASLNWQVGLAPLVDEPFNRCKAPTKFIEYTAAGTPVIASRVDVYQAAMPPGGGLLVCRNEWYEAISKMLDSAELRRTSLRAARSHCESVYSTAILMHQVEEVFARAER